MRRAHESAESRRIDRWAAHVIRARFWKAWRGLCREAFLLDRQIEAADSLHKKHMCGKVVRTLTAKPWAEGTGKLSRAVNRRKEKDVIRVLKKLV